MRAHARSLARTAGSVIKSGWVIKPIKTEAGETHSEVTYVAHADLMGYVPSYFAESINATRPLLVAEIARIVAAEQRASLLTRIL